MSVVWNGGQDLGALAGQPLQLVFRLNGASLYSFWLSVDAACGASGGFLGGGGRREHGMAAGVDIGGSCSV
jgi:hypothetical protein